MLTARLTKQIKKQQGFTLIELLVVIGILAVLLAITLIAINPAKQFSQANDTKRRSDVNAILNAIDQFAADNAGKLPATATAISATPTLIGTGANEIDICSFLVTTYLAALPSDPTTGNPTGQIPSTCAAPYETGYKVSKSAADNRVTVQAVSEINPGTPISVTR